MREIESRNSGDLASHALAPLMEPMVEPAGAVSAPDEFEQFVEQFMRCLREGLCPACHAEVDFMQKGIHVVGSCGHRIYIGRKPRVRKNRRTAAALPIDGEV